MHKIRMFSAIQGTAGSMRRRQASRHITPCRPLLLTRATAVLRYENAESLDRASEFPFVHGFLHCDRRLGAERGGTTHDRGHGR